MSITFQADTTATTCTLGSYCSGLTVNGGINVVVKAEDGGTGSTTTKLEI